MAAWVVIVLGTSGPAVRRVGYVRMMAAWFWPISTLVEIRKLRLCELTFVEIVRREGSMV
jgi:hypothetical protein